MCEFQNGQFLERSSESNRAKNYKQERLANTKYTADRIDVGKAAYSLVS